jgi:hypothetical protein
MHVEGRRDLSRCLHSRATRATDREQGLYHRCQLKVSLAVETAATQTKPACAGYQTLDFPSVRVGGLRLYSLRILFARA